MPAIREILFSTSRQWNPGDEFVLFGVLNLLRDAGIEFNPIIFNRNPEVTQGATSLNPLRALRVLPRGEWLWGSFLRAGFRDNSFKPGMQGEWLDSVVFAGTPAWRMREVRPIYSLIRQLGLPTAFFGIGGFRGGVNSIREPNILEVLKASSLLTVRDEVTYASLAEFGAVLLPCPSLWASQPCRQVESVGRVGLIYATNRSVRDQCIETDIHRALVEHYRALLGSDGGQIEFEFVVHYIDDLHSAHREFGTMAPIRYSFDARDYLDIYSRFDLVVGPRVHGIGLAASLGVPGIHLAHDELRSGAVAGFLATALAPRAFFSNSEFRSAFDMAITHAPERSRALSRHKYRCRSQYLDLIRGRMSGWF